MKNLLLIIIIIFSTAFIAQEKTYVNIGETITSTDTFAHELQFNKIYDGQYQLIYIHLKDSNDNGIRFKVGDSVNMLIQSAFYGGAKVPLTIDNGKRNLFYKANSIGQTFVVTN